MRRGRFHCAIQWIGFVSTSRLGVRSLFAEKGFHLDVRVVLLALLLLGMSQYTFFFETGEHLIRQRQKMQLPLHLDEHESCKLLKCKRLVGCILIVAPFKASKHGGDPPQHQMLFHVFF